jgi:protein FAM50
VCGVGRVEQPGQEPQKQKKKKRKVKKVGLLSFDLDECEGGGEEDVVVVKKRKKSIKNPDVETDFLPDKERELEEARERKRLRAEWEDEQERIKSASRCLVSSPKK